MKAHERPLTFLGNEGQIKIPFFQRGYIWNIENWEDLLNGLFDTNRSHFLGSLIIKQLSTSGEPKLALVIDGQQRLTTLSILLRCLYNRFDEQTQKNCETVMNTNLFYKKNATDAKFLVKIKHSRIDSGYFQKVIENEVTADELKNVIVADSRTKPVVKSNDHPILQCYKYFTVQLKEKPLEKCLDLFNRLLNPSNQIMVVIDLTEKEDEQSIFDTINSTGVRLSSSDIVKNALFQKALDNFDENSVNELYKNNWEDIFTKDDDTLNFWGMRRLTGRFMRDNIEILFHSFGVIRGFYDPEKHTLSDLSKLYKEEIKNLSGCELKAFIENIAKFANLYRKNVLVFDETSLFTFSDYRSRLFHVLNTLDVSAFHPYVLSLFEKYQGNEPKLRQELHKIESLVIRRLFSRSGTKGYNKMCKDLIGNPIAIDGYLKDKDVDDNVVKDGLLDIGNRQAALLLFWVELFRRSNDALQSLKELKYDYSLEHIMPQKWENNWKGVPVYGKDGKVVTDEKGREEVRGAAIYSIGNMTLLNSRLNSALSNKEFRTKVEGEGRKKGMKDYSDLSITREVIEISEWDERAINDRTKNLTNEILVTSNNLLQF
jgi:uncharacterized protein with ParB-like and HNH nuclease domain